MSKTPSCAYCNKHFSNWKDLYYHICNIEEYERADYNQALSKQGQSILTTSSMPIQQEVNDENMKIPEQALSGGSNKGGLPFLKAADLGYTLGQTQDFQISGDIEVGGSAEAPLYSAPVSYLRNGQKLQGQYSLNKTSLRTLTSKLDVKAGQEFDFTGVRFTAFVGPVRNPKTGTQGLGFAILADSVKSRSAK